MTLVLDTKGAHRVTFDELSRIEAPPPTDSWKPIPHSRVLEVTADSLGQMGFQVEKMDLAVARDGAQFFGTLDLRHNIGDGVTLAVGLRNSTDKSLSAGLCAGERVFVCSNLAFRADISFARKHTTRVEEDFNVQVVKAILALRQYSQLSTGRIQAMQARELSEVEADSLMLRAYERGIVGARLLPQLISEWREPSFEEFRPRTAWSFFNCFTHVLKDRQQSQPIAASQEVIRFNQLCA